MKKYKRASFVRIYKILKNIYMLKDSYIFIQSYLFFYQVHRF